MPRTKQQPSEQLDAALTERFNEVVDDLGNEEAVLASFKETSCLHDDEIAVEDCRKCLGYVAEYSDDDEFAEEAERILRSIKKAKPSRSRFIQADPEEYSAARAEYDNGTIPEGWEEVESRNGFLYIRKLNPDFVEVEKETSSPVRAGGNSRSRSKAAKKAEVSKGAAKAARRAGRISKEIREAAPLRRPQRTVMDGLRTIQENLNQLVKLADKGALDSEGVIEQAAALGIKIPSKINGYVAAKLQDQAKLDEEARQENGSHIPQPQTEAVITGKDGIALSKAEAAAKLQAAGLRVTLTEKA